jgi:pyruvate,water dikinase
VSNVDALESASKDAMTIIACSKIPKNVTDDIIESYQKMGNCLVAVRSSATSEDGKEQSFAGQNSTFLNIAGEDDVVNAVKACWASLFEARAIFYRADNGGNYFSDLAIAVPVQKMVQSDVSGVMFTINPLTNNHNEIVIESVWGLGEGIVGGEITPDTDIIAKNGFIAISGNRTNQSWKYVYDVTNGGTKKSNVAKNKVHAIKLSASDIISLSEFALRLESHYGYPQDIEWAIEDGKVYILQTRPVTTLGEHAEETVISKVGEPILVGSPASRGKAFGTVRIVNSIDDLNLVQKGDVLVAEMTDPDYLSAMRKAVAIVTNLGGRTCHAAIISRELGIPSVVACINATKVLKNGMMVSVDGTEGKIYEGRMWE